LDQAKIYADSSRLLYESIRDKNGVSRYDFLLGTIERAKGNYLESKQYFDVFLHAVTEQKDTGFLASVHFQLGIVHEVLGHLDKALEHQYASIRYYESQGNIAGTNHGLNTLGSIYRKLKQYEKSEELYKRALEVNKEIGSLVGRTSD
jgi:tetratricopeptide (TPR) repeat protein